MFEYYNCGFLHMEWWCYLRTSIHNFQHANNITDNKKKIFAFVDYDFE